MASANEGVGAGGRGGGPRATERWCQLNTHHFEQSNGEGRSLRGGPGGGGKLPILPIIILDNLTPGVGGPRTNPSSPEVCITGDGVVDESLTTAGWTSCRCDKVGVEGPVEYH